MNIRKIARGSAWKLVNFLPLLLIGCTSESGVDPTIKVESGKSADESVSKVRTGGADKHEPAPLQRTKVKPG